MTGFCATWQQKICTARARTSASSTILLPSGQMTWSTWERTRSHVSSGVRRLACRVSTTAWAAFVFSPHSLFLWGLASTSPSTSLTQPLTFPTLKEVTASFNDLLPSSSAHLDDSSKNKTAFMLLWQKKLMLGLRFVFTFASVLVPCWIYPGRAGTVTSTVVSLCQKRAQVGDWPRRSLCWSAPCCRQCSRSSCGRGSLWPPRSYCLVETLQKET